MEIVFILIEPKVPENIGASARAMKTMGFTNLRLVNPVEDHLHVKSRTLAHGANDVLENAGLYNTLSDAVRDVDYVIGTSAKDRRVFTKAFPVNDLKKVLEEKEVSVKKAAIVFGREESGLTNEEIGLCDIASFVPMNNLYPSLNLSQAVMIYAHHLFLGEVQGILSNNEKSNTNSFKELKAKIVDILNDMDVNKNPALYGRIMERVSSVNDEDIHLLHSLIKYYLKRKF